MRRAHLLTLLTTLGALSTLLNGTVADCLVYPWLWRREDSPAVVVRKRVMRNVTGGTQDCIARRKVENLINQILMVNEQIALKAKGYLPFPWLKDFQLYQ